MESSDLLRDSIANSGAVNDHKIGVIHRCYNSAFQILSIDLREGRQVAQCSAWKAANYGTMDCQVQNILRP